MPSLLGLPPSHPAPLAWSSLSPLLPSSFPELSLLHLVVHICQCHSSNLCHPSHAPRVHLSVLYFWSRDFNLVFPTALLPSEVAFSSYRTVCQISTPFVTNGLRRCRAKCSPPASREGQVIRRGVEGSVAPAFLGLAGPGLPAGDWLQADSIRPRRD